LDPGNPYNIFLGLFSSESEFPILDSHFFDVLLKDFQFASLMDPQSPLATELLLLDYPQQNPTFYYSQTCTIQDDLNTLGPCYIHGYLRLLNKFSWTVVTKGKPFFTIFHCLK
jgi:hypothetical protein